MIWNKVMECADRETMAALQLKKIKESVKYQYERIPYYKEKMDKAGVKPEDIQTIEDFHSVPFMEKQDFADNYPTGLFARPMSDIVRIHASSGTTGKPKIVGYTADDIELWAECFAHGLHDLAGSICHYDGSRGCDYRGGASCGKGHRGRERDWGSKIVVAGKVCGAP